MDTFEITFLNCPAAKRNHLLTELRHMEDIGALTFKRPTGEPKRFPAQLANASYAVYSYLYTHTQATIKELERDVHYSSAALWKALSALTEAGIVRRVNAATSNHPGRAGKRAHVYILIKEGEQEEEGTPKINEYASQFFDEMAEQVFFDEEAA